MSAKKAAVLNTGYPIFGIKFIDNKTVLAVGGGGEGNNGVPNKITAVKCSLKVKDQNRRLQKYREITLPPNEDSPMCVDAARTIGDDGNKNNIFVGCNQSTALIKNMNVNNNLRKYGFSDEEHLRFLDAVQYENAVSAESVGEYPKIISMSPESEIGAFMTSHLPSEVSIFRPDSLELVAKIRASTEGEVKDFQVSQDNGKSLCLVTSSTIEVISTATGRPESTSAQADKKSIKVLAKYNLSKMRFISDTNIVVTGASKNGKGTGILRYDIVNHKVVQESLVTKKNVLVVAMDVSVPQNLIALAGNDICVTFLRLSDLKVISTVPKLHQFALTSLSFSPSGTKLASGSASQTLNVMPIPPNFAKGSSFVWSFFKLLMFFFVIAAGIFLQQALQAGQLDQYIQLLEQHIGPIDHYVDLSKKHGGQVYDKAQVYGKVALELSQKYGSEYYDKAQVYGKIGYEVLKDKSAYGLDLIKEKLNRDKLDDGDDTKQFFTMTDWEDKPENLVQTETTSTAAQPNDTLNDIVSEVTKAVDHLTNAEGEIDTDSIISEAVTLEISTLDTAVPDEEPSSIETIDPEAQETESTEDQAVETDVTSQDEPVESESSVNEPSLETPPVEESEQQPESVAEEPESVAEEPESFAGTVLEDVGEVPEPTNIPVEGEVEDVPTEEAAFENAEPEVVVEEEITPETVSTGVPEVSLNNVEEAENVEAEQPEISLDAPEVAEAEIPEPTEESLEQETEISSSESSVASEPVEDPVEEVAEESVSVEEVESPEIVEPAVEEVNSSTPDVPVEEPIEQPSEQEVIKEVEDSATVEVEDSEVSSELPTETSSTASDVAPESESTIETEQVAEPSSEPTNETSDVTTAESVSETSNEPSEGPAIEQESEVSTEPIAESIEEPVAQSVEEPVVSSVEEPVASSNVEPVEPSASSIIEEPVVSSNIEPVEPAGSSIIDSESEPIVESPAPAEESVQASSEPVKSSAESKVSEKSESSVSESIQTETSSAKEAASTASSSEDAPSIESYQSASQSAEEEPQSVSTTTELLSEAMSQLSSEVSSLKSSATAAAHDEL
ncbi:uncharacterized protein CXQ87_004122 [Candidozyma duobushaemuli]|uniref:Guanine nucleotide-exchange factor SEC12 n=2 Tax=Candidozyma TaxID=3303203 RepID=A0ABX8I7J5_9ASCO|nr:uncharacterized protein CXQ87_004122 [[Candida] duobushaemulonis]PVH16250.1 hypothetical protein CXQ87_004122 [[Candida] duobushaemulonis]QWU89084.1 hypothetical protein CA3LBN_003407 [[Candida] haemuloni]